MAKLTLYTTGKLTATDDPRVKTGLLLPFGEIGRTNKGKLTAAAGVLQIADDLDPLTLEHDDKAPIATLQVEEVPAGLQCSVRYLETTAGNDALAEYEAGVRTGLSVEIDDLARTGKGPTIRAGKLIAGLVTGGSQVRTPAFMSAKLAAADVPDAPDQGATPDFQTVYEGDVIPTVELDGEPLDGVSKVTVSEKTIAITTSTDTTDPTTQENPMTASRTPVAGKLQATALQPKPKDDKLKASVSDFASLMGRYYQTLDGKLLAALNDVTPANILGVDQPMFIDEAWSGQPYARQVVPGFNHADLTDFEITGWTWDVKPEGGDYAGNNGPIPTNTIKTKAVDAEAERWAMGHGFDLKYKHFPRPSFWESYIKAGAESYARWSDAKALAEIVAAAPYVAPGVVPDGVNTALTYIVDGVIAVLNETNTIADGAYLATDLWRDLMLVRADDALAYLNAMLGFDEATLTPRNFQIKPLAALTAGQALVKCKPAATIHELAGAPIRVEALAIANGKVDEGMFGYQGVVLHDEGGLALVAATDPNA